MAKVTIQKDKGKHYKAKVVVRFIIALLFLLIGMSIVGYSLFNEYVYTHLPTDVVERNTISVFTKTMISEEYMELADVVITLADEGNGPMLSPFASNQISFDYEGEYLARLSTTSGSGLLVVGKGSGDVRADIEHYGKYYDQFVGNLTTKYKENIFEEGTINGFKANYSAGKIVCSTPFMKDNYYVIAIEYEVSSSNNLFVVYATKDFKELKKNISLIKNFSTLTLKGKATDEDILENSIKEKSSEESIEEINAYISEKYDVEKENVGVVPSSVSSNAVDDVEDIEVTIEEGKPDNSTAPTE